MNVLKASCLSLMIHTEYSQQTSSHPGHMSQHGDVHKQNRIRNCSPKAR